MKHKKFSIIPIAAVVIAYFLMPALCHARYDYIDITNPFLKKIPIAIPLFKSMNGGNVELKSAETATQLLFDTLEFTGYFKMIDKGAFLEYPHITGITISELTFKNWRDINAELLVTGGITILKDRVSLELRLFDPFKVTRLIGKKYSAQLPDHTPETIKENVRTMINRFCGEMIHHQPTTHLDGLVLPTERIRIQREINDHFFRRPCHAAEIRVRCVHIGLIQRDPNLRLLTRRLTLPRFLHDHALLFLGAADFGILCHSSVLSLNPTLFLVVRIKAEPPVVGP